MNSEQISQDTLKSGIAEVQVVNENSVSKFQKSGFGESLNVDQTWPPRSFRVKSAVEISQLIEP